MPEVEWEPGYLFTFKSHHYISYLKPSMTSYCIRGAGGGSQSPNTGLMSSLHPAPSCPPCPTLTVASFQFLEHIHVFGLGICALASSLSGALFPRPLKDWHLSTSSDKPFITFQVRKLLQCLLTNSLYGC